VSDSGELTVPMLSMDSILDRMEAPDETFLKMDIEGAEAGVFDAELGWLDASRGVIMEVHAPVADESHIRDLLAESGMVLREGSVDARPCWVRKQADRSQAPAAG
jgi:hypothetical protein